MKFSSRKLIVLFILTLLAAACGGGGGGGGTTGNDGNNNTGGTSTGTGGVATDKIFFMHFPDWSTQTNDMYMIYGDGSGERRLTFTNANGYKTFFGLSSDGYAVYYAQPTPSSYQRLFSVPLNNASASTNKQLETGSGGDSMPYVLTGDGRVIYGIGVWPSDPAPLYSVKADGSEAAKTLSAAAARFYGLTTSGLAIFSDQTQGLFSINPSNPSEITKISSATTWYQNSVAIDGNIVTFATNTALFTANTATTASPVQLDTGSITNVKVANGILFYNTSTRNLYTINYDGTGKTHLATAGTGYIYFQGLSPDNKVIYSSSPSGQDDIFSVSLSGISSGTTTTLASGTDQDVFKGVTSDNRVIIETGPTMDYYHTITSIKTDGTGLVTLASGTTGTDIGGVVKSITPDGWVVYKKGNASSSLTSVKVDNSARSVFYDMYGGQYLANSLTSNNKFVVQTLDSNSSAYRMYIVAPAATEAHWLRTATAYTGELVMKVVP